MFFLTLTSISQHTPLPEQISISAWTPETVLITIGFGIITILIAIVSFFAKKQLNDILNTIHLFSDRQSECRESLSIRFADRIETASHIRALIARADKQHEVLTRHDVLLNGNCNHLNSGWYDE